MKTRSHLLIITLIILFTACSGNRSSNVTLPVIDVTKKYPKKEIRLQDMFDVEYVPLETSDKVLMNKYAQIAWVSSEKIIAYDSKIGSVFIFDRKGKFVSQFNHKGESGQEYHSITELIYDEENHEFIVLDYVHYERFQVFDEKGNYKRTLPFPPNCDIEEAMNFDKEMMVAYDAKYLLESDKIGEARKHPFVLISKKDGQLVSNIPIEVQERISARFKMKINDESTRVLIISGTYIFKYGSGFAFYDISCDTVFSYNTQCEKVPLFVRYPPIHSMGDPKTVVFVKGFTKDYFFFNTFINECNFSTHKIGERVGLVYEKTSGKTFTSKIYNEDFPDEKEATSKKNSLLISADMLIDALEKNKLYGKLKDIASTLDADDNPIVMILKIKE